MCCFQKLSPLLVGFNPWPLTSVHTLICTLQRHPTSWSHQRGCLDVAGNVFGAVAKCSITDLLPPADIWSDLRHCLMDKVVFEQNLQNKQKLGVLKLDCRWDFEVPFLEESILKQRQGEEVLQVGTCSKSALFPWDQRAQKIFNHIYWDDWHWQGRVSIFMWLEHKEYKDDSRERRVRSWRPWYVVCRRQNSGPQRQSRPKPWNLWMYQVTWQGGINRGNQICQSNDLKMERLS